MKTNRTWSLLVALTLGLTAGVVVSPWIVRPPAAKGSKLLREFSLTSMLAEAGSTNWEVMEDRTYKPFPPLARYRGIARRIVVRAELSDAELAQFTMKFQPAASATLEAQGAHHRSAQSVPRFVTSHRWQTDTAQP